MNDLAARRASALAEAGWTRRSADADLAAGRLLIFLPALTLSDGAAEDVSSGLFDAYNQPPWDTWIWYVRRREVEGDEGPFLVCWIPECLVHLADSGIDANPEKCILWIEGSEPRTQEFLNRLLA